MAEQLASQHGFAPGQFAGTQNYYDQLRGRRYQQISMEAGGAAAQRDIRKSADLFAGAGQLTGIYDPGFRTGTEEKDKKQRKHFDSLMGTLEDNAGLLLFADMVMPGMQILDTLSAASGGSEGVLTAHLQASRRRRIDPTTGERGLSAESLTQQSGDIAEELYGELNDPDITPARSALVRQRVHGLKLGRIGEGISAFERRGMGPDTLNNKLSQKEIDTIKYTHGDGAEVSADSLRSALGGSNDGAGTDLSTAELEKLAELIEKNSGNIDVALRKFDSSKTADWAKKMTGLVSSMEDIFGPGQSIDNMIEGLNQLTQNSLASKSKGEVENIARRMHAGMQATGMNAQQTARLTAMAADVIEQGGGQREDAALSTMHAQSFTKSIDESGLGSEGLSFAGVKKSTLIAHDAMLHGRAMTSPVNNQLAMVVRLNETLNVDPESDLGKRAEAIKNGKKTYESSKGTKSIYSEDFSELTDEISRAQNVDKQDLNISAQQSREFLSQENVNLSYGNRFDTASTLRGMQWDLDVKGALARQIESSLAEESEVTPAQIGNALEEIVKFKPLSKAALEEKLGRKIDDADVNFANREVLASNMAEQMGGNLVAAETALGRVASDTERLFGVKSGEIPFLFNPDRMDDTKKHDEKLHTAADARKAVSGIGKAGFLESAVTAISEIKKGGDVSLEGVLAKAFGGVSSDHIEALIKNQDLPDDVKNELLKQLDPEGTSPKAGSKELDTLLAKLEKIKKDTAKANAEKLAAAQKTATTAAKKPVKGDEAPTDIDAKYKELGLDQGDDPLGGWYDTWSMSDQEIAGAKQKRINDRLAQMARDEGGPAKRSSAKTTEATAADANKTEAEKLGNDDAPSDLDPVTPSDTQQGTLSKQYPRLTQARDFLTSVIMEGTGLLTDNKPVNNETQSADNEKQKETMELTGTLKIDMQKMEGIVVNTQGVLGQAHTHV